MDTSLHSAAAGSVQAPLLLQQLLCKFEALSSTPSKKVKLRPTLAWVIIVGFGFLSLCSSHEQNSFSEMHTSLCPFQLKKVVSCLSSPIGQSASFSFYVFVWQY
jgi:hypothetical protein